MNRKITYRLNKMRDWAKANRMSGGLAFEILRNRWLYLKGDRGEAMENRIFELYERYKQEAS